MFAKSRKFFILCHLSVYKNANKKQILVVSQTFPRLKAFKFIGFLKEKTKKNNCFSFYSSCMLFSGYFGVNSPVYAGEDVFNFENKIRDFSAKIPQKTNNIHSVLIIMMDYKKTILLLIMTL